MGTRYECDVAGCEGHASKSGNTIDGPTLPDGWYFLTVKLPMLKEFKERLAKSEGPNRMRVRRRMRRMMYRQAIVCPLHPPVDLKSVPPRSYEEEENDDYGYVPDMPIDL